MNNGPERKHFPAFPPTLDTGFDDYLVKPVDMEELTALLNELIEVLAGSGVFGSSNYDGRAVCKIAGGTRYLPVP